MSKHKSKQTGNIGTTPKAKGEKPRRERDLLRPSSETECIDKCNGQVKIEKAYQYVSIIDTQNKNTNTILKTKTQNT